MSIYNLPPLLAGLVILFLGGLAIGKGPKGKVNRAWAGLALCLAIWSFGTFTLYISPDEQTAISWLVLYNIGVIFIPATFLHFALTLSDDSSKLGKRLTVVVYSISGLFIVLSLLKYFNPGVSHHPWGYYPVTGPVNIYYDGFFAIVLAAAVIRLIWAFRRSTGWKRNQYIYIFIAALIGFGSGVTNFLPLYGGRVYPMGHIGILLTATIITVAIIKYRLMDINVIIRNSAIYSILTAIIAAAYVGLVFVMQSAFRGWTGNNSSLAVVIVALIIAMTFEPVRRNVQRGVDKVFFRQKYEHQEVVRDINEKLHSEVSPANIAALVLNTLITTIQISRGWLMVFDRKSDKFLIVASHSTPTDAPLSITIDRDSRLVEILLHTRHPVWLEDPEVGVLRRHVDIALKERLRAAGAEIVLPLHGKKDLVGLLFLSHKKSGDIFSHNDMELMMTICDQAAISIESSRLYDDLQASYLNTVKSLVAALEAKDEYTKGHSERVANYARSIAEEMKLSDKECQLLYEVSLLHDVGKIGVSEHILNKKSKLTRSEYLHVQSHTTTGEKILSTIESIRDGLSTVRHHHERLNGDGYPDGLSEVNIPLTARILAVADAYDAMTTKRPYRKAMTAREAIEELKDHAGKQFDPRAVRAFIAVVVRKKTKTSLRSIRSTKGHEALRTA